MTAVPDEAREGRLRYVCISCDDDPLHDPAALKWADSPLRPPRNERPWGNFAFQANRALVTDAGGNLGPASVGCVDLSQQSDLFASEGPLGNQPQFRTGWSGSMIMSCRQIIYRCPRTGMNVQHQLDDAALQRPPKTSTFRCGVRPAPRCIS